MTIINPNSIAGITSVTAEAGVMNFYKSDGTLAGLQLNGVNFNTTSGISTFNNVYVGGTITYEDVKNVDSVGIVTARTGVKVLAGGLNVVGASYFNDNIVATASTATSITVTDESSDSMTFPLFVTASVSGGLVQTANLAPQAGSNFYFNSSTGALSATSINGNIVGGTVSGTTGTFTGDISIADKIIHTGDTNTAIRFPAADTFSVETGGSERFRINSSGDVGIGVDPASGVKLHIKDTSSDGAIKLEGTGSTLGTWIALQNNDATANSYTMIQGADAGGQGTSEIKFINVNNSNNEGALTIGTRPSGGSMTERLRITSDGKIGINDASPAVTLHVQGSGGAVSPSSYSVLDLAIEDNAEAALGIIGNSYSSIYFGDAATVLNGGIIYNHSDNSLTLRKSGNLEAFRIASDGKVGINETTPERQLDVNGDILGTAFMLKSNTSASSGSQAHMFRPADNTLAFATNGANERLRITSAGKVGVGVASPTRTLTVQSNGGQIAINDTDNTQGELFVNGGDFSAFCRGNSNLGDGSTGGYFTVWTHPAGGSIAERLRITSTGLLGLNLSPVYSGLFGGNQLGMHIGGSTAPFLRITSSTSSQGDLILHASNSASNVHIGNQAAAGDIVFWTKPSSGSIAARVTITDTGYVDCSSTVALKVPSGTTAQRPTGVNGMLRYNSSTNILEGYINSAWSSISQDNLASNGSYANNTAAIDDDLYVYWNCNSTSTTRTGGDSGAATHYGVSASSGKVNNYWNRGTATSNGIKLTSMPTSNNLSISFWFIQTDNTIHSTSDGAKILTLHNGDCGSTSAPVLGYDGSNGTVLRAGGTGWVSSGTQIATITTNTWYHIGITKSGNDWKYYFNGSLQHSPTESQCLASTWWISNYSRIGNNNNNNNHFHRGGIDEFAVWHRTLSATEISAIYTASAAGTPLI